MTDGYRKAALKLHGMNAADQGWMLQHLPEGERARLKALLYELDELGIKSGRHVSDGIAADEARQRLLSTVAQPEAAAHALDALSAASVDEISALLAAEPDDVVATVLAAYPWPWRSHFLAECGVEKRHRLNRAFKQVPLLKPRLRSELIKLLSNRLAGFRSQGLLLSGYAGEHTVSASTPHVRTFWKGVRRWLP